MMASNNFTHFLREYRIVALSVAFVISLAVLGFVQSLVNDILLPLLRPLISKNSNIWEEIIFSIGSVNLRVGSFLSASLNLAFILLFFYIFLDKILKWKPKK